MADIDKSLPNVRHEIKIPGAQAPTGGPMHQGLRSLYNNVKKS